MPVPDRLSMAVGRSGSAGSQHNRAVPDRAVPGGIGGSVLPAGEKAERGGTALYGARVWKSIWHR